ncbi:hypothetical protein K227x_08440 [Rubripirellula lacrimiformis]|uniref:Uncharacterized protein n=1 Tax=Rubripirellula lacrimiformis TaxID=1930273 RepID=A0A517N5P5_9BACT|nr:hypothetical protein [Rubripirellula lacrimiformis]QDT02467.1 hypothetical protein K227x_08440 [Rubripirellula lacrimiformis]
MIAALATCFFVVYLYRSLNPSDPVAPDAAANGTSQDPPSQDLSGRLDALELRLQSLVDQAKEGSQS